MPAVKEPVNLMQQDGKRPDGTTLLPWAWDVTVADTYAESPLAATTLTAGAAADKAAANKEMKYCSSQHSHLLSYHHRDFRRDESAGV